MHNCVFCQKVDGELVFEDEESLFKARWDFFPATPGHSLVIPKRHVRHFQELTDEELLQLPQVVRKLKQYLHEVDLARAYQRLLQSELPENASDCIVQRLAAYAQRPPDAFNDGLNDGEAAGQTVPHLHWHVMPRWVGDMEDPKGGIKRIFRRHSS